MSRYKLPVEQQLEAEAAPVALRPAPVMPVASAAAPVPAPQQEAVTALQTQLQQLQAENDRLQRQLRQQSAAEQASAQAAQRFQQDIEALQQMQNSLADDCRAQVQQLTRHLADIVVAAMIKLLGQQLTHPDSALAAIQSVVHQAGYRDALRVRVSPRDYALIQKHLPTGSQQSIDYLCDDQVKLGGCMIDTDPGRLDGRIEVQLQVLYERLQSVQPSVPAMAKPL